MRQKEIEKIRKGDFVEHKQLGLCVVYEVQLDGLGRWFGLSIRPLSIAGYMILLQWSGTLFNRMLEHSIRRIISKVENPVIPKLIFLEKKKYVVYEWKKLGEVTPEGVFSRKKIKDFPTLEEAQTFSEA